MYYVVEEATGEICANIDNFKEAINDAKQKRGKYLVIDDNGKIRFDSMPGVTFKI